MSRSDDASPPSVPPSLLSLAARAKREHGDALAHDTPAPARVSLPSSTAEILKRLAAHSEHAQRYTVRSEIARGGMGAVFEVWEEDLHRSLAMKVAIDVEGAPAGHVSDRGLPKVARFLEEAQVTAQLDHPGIVPVHELGLDDAGRLYFTMKRVAGRTLAQVFELVAEERDGWNEARALYVILKACDAVSYAHKKGVIHRDLKPANVMVGSFGEVYVMDWGLARVIGRADRHDMRLRPQGELLTSVRTDRRGVREGTPDSPLMTMDGDVLGTPAYMSPEQARNEVAELGPRSDVYAIGAMLYHLLSGQAPYLPRGSRVASYVVLRWLLEGPPQPLHEIRPDLPAELGAICDKAMARDPERRYADMRELADDLRAYLENRVVSAYETGPLAEIKKWVGRNKGVTFATAAGLLIAFAALGGISIVQSNAKRAIEGKNELLQRSEASARKEKERAQASEELARKRSEDVFSLSALQDLQELIDQAGTLWPANQRMVARYDEWLERARVLIDGRAADPVRGIKATPSLPENRQRLLALRSRAIAQTREEADADRIHHPSAAELAWKQRKWLWMSRMIGAVPWPPELVFTEGLQYSSVMELNNVVWSLVGWDRSDTGSEVEGLILARCELESRLPGDMHATRDSLAWALFHLGRFSEALIEERRALWESPRDAKPTMEASLRRLEDLVRSWLTRQWEKEDVRSQLALDVERLRHDVVQRRTWRFADSDDVWWHAQLSKLVAELEAFTDPETGLRSDGISKEFGWGVARRLQFARSVVERSIDDTNSRAAWTAAIEAIAASPVYGGLKLAPQVGLVPIGVDPQSGLWEFAHLLTGDAPSRDDEGRLMRKESMGLVFVLIPGGTFEMGAQRTWTHAANFDIHAQDQEGPVNRVDLAPFFLSKYEMTQGQWLRFMGGNPSHYGVGGIYLDRFSSVSSWANLLHPVEMVSWSECTNVLQRLELVLPTEAQWECAARAATTTAWSSGDAPETLADCANLYDTFAQNNGLTGANCERWLDDGYVVHAPVGSFRANPFGLHDMHGNVLEWCADTWTAYTQPARGRDGERSAPGTMKNYRGGAFHYTATNARVSSRAGARPDLRLNNLGLRPARKIDP